MKRFLLSLALIAGLSVAVPPTATATPTPTPSIDFTILGPTTTPNWVTFVIDLKYYSGSSSESLTVTYELKGSSATQLAYLRCSHDECYPRQVEATAYYSPGSITIKPNSSTSSAVSAYIKIQICDLKSACTENLSPGIYQVGITVRDWLGNQRYLEVNPIVPVPTLSPTDLACREKITALNNMNKLIDNNLSSWRSLWTNNNELEAFMKSKGLTLASAYSYYLGMIREQNANAKSNNQLLLDIKLECSIISIYGEWSSAFQYSSNIVNFALETRNYVYQKYEAKAAEELRQKQEAEAKAAAELKAKQEAEAKAAADAAILKLQIDEFNEISAAYREMMNKIVAMKLTFPFTSSLLGMETKMKKLTIALGEDPTTARTNITNVNKWLDANKKVWEKTQKMVITCVKGKLTKKVTAVKPKCPSGYKVKK